MNNSLSQDSYRCIGCGGVLYASGGHLTCRGCAAVFEIRGGIPILTRKERYWCNIPRVKMRELNRDAMKGSWQEAVEKHINGNVVDHVSDNKRVDFRYILPSLKDKKVLDIGAMWGGIAMPLSRYCAELHAIDTTFETLQFLSIRANQEGSDNVRVALASARRLPFGDGYFDVVLLIGVLEWLGSDYDFVVSEHYGKPRHDRLSKKGNPSALQKEALKEACRVLKPGGTMLIAIENRFFYKHFFGAPDPHTAAPFSSILPRPMADIYMRLRGRQDYSEYTYSYKGYEKILKGTGFGNLSFYAALPSYRELEVIIPLDKDRSIEYYYEKYALKDVSGLRRLIPRIILKLNVMKHFVPSFLITAEKYQ